MFGQFGATELIIILVILLLLFGPSRLGELGSSLGKGIKGFKKSMKDDDEIDVTPKNEKNHEINDTSMDGFKSPNQSQKSEK